MKAILEFKAQKITSKMSIRYYKIIKWKPIYVKEEYQWFVKYTIVKIIKTIDMQQLVCKTALKILHSISGSTII